MSDAPDDLARTLAAEVDGIALIIASTSGSAGAPALTAAEAIVEHLASVVSRRDADLRTRIEALVDRRWNDGYHSVTIPEIRDALDADTHEVARVVPRSGYGAGAGGAHIAARSRLPADTDTGRGQ